MFRSVFIAVSLFYILGLLLAGMVYIIQSAQIIAIAALLPEISLLFYLVFLTIQVGRNVQLLLASVGMICAILSTFSVVYYAENEGSALASLITNALRFTFYILSFGYVANKNLGMESFKSIKYWSLIGGSIVVFLPALYLFDLDYKGFKMIIAVQFAFSYVLLIQSLRRYGLVSWKAYLAGIGSVLGFVLSDTFFGFAEYHGMPLAYEFSHIVYFTAQYLFILGIQLQYTSRKWVRPELQS
jgi:hypothetical protein